MSVFVCSVTPDCLDGKGLAKIPAIYEIIINAIGLHIREEGFGVDDMARQGLSWALARCAVEFGRRPSLYEKLTVDVRNGEQKGLTFARNVRVFDAGGNFIATGVTEWCAIDIASHRPALFDAPAGVGNDLRPCASPGRLRPFVSVTGRKQKVGYSECDFNGHLNNCRYVEMFYDLLPQRVVTLPGGVRLDINFVREVPLGGEVISYLKSKDGSAYDYCLHYDGSAACCASISPMSI